MVPEQLANNGWSSDKWEQLESQAREVVNRYSRLRQVIPRGSDLPGVYVVPELEAHDKDGEISLSITKAAPPESVEARFSLSMDQSADADIASRLVDRAARVLASQEDERLSRLLKKGPLGSVESDDPAALVATAVNQLRLAANPYVGPFCLLAAPALWRVIAMPTTEHPRGLKPAMETLLGEGSRIIDVPSLDEGAPSILFALDPFALELVTVEPPSLSMTGLTGGSLALQLRERFYLRIVDGEARRSLTLVGAAASKASRAGKR